MGFGYLNLDVLEAWGQRPGSIVVANLFPDAQYRIVFQRLVTTQQTRSWFGVIEGEDLTLVHINVSNESRQVLGDIRLPRLAPRGAYVLDASAGGAVVIYELDLSAPTPPS